MPTHSTIALIEATLQAAFTPTLLNVADESHLHIGHAGAADGKGHYALTIHSQAFVGKTLIQRHRMIYAALGELMQSHIHALKIKAKTS